MSLINTFLRLIIPNSENSKLFNTLTLKEFSFAKIGVNSEGFPVILISSAADKTFLSQKNVRLKHIELTHNLECKVSENGNSKFDNFTVIIFKSEERDLQSYFLGIAETLLQSLSKNPSQKEIFETFKNFVEIFCSLSNVPSKTLQGLWAELFLIESAKNTECLLNYWHNIPEEKFDFNADVEKIEVKSSCSLERIHFFSAEQLAPVNKKQVLIASVFTKQISNGKSINDLLQSIQIKVSETYLREKVFLIVSQTLGGSIEQSIKIKYDYDLALNSLKFYRDLDISKIEKQNIPQRVSEVKYKSDLTYVQDIQPIDLKEKSLIFWAL